jgi:hypothetical protein
VLDAQDNLGKLDRPHQGEGASRAKKLVKFPGTTHHLVFQHSRHEVFGSIQGLHLALRDSFENRFPEGVERWSPEHGPVVRALVQNVVPVQLGAAQCVDLGRSLTRFPHLQLGATPCKIADRV